VPDLRKYAVQKPKGKKWETLALVDDVHAGQKEFQAAVAQHGRGYVRLIQVDFKTADVLSDYDWSLLDLHDPFKGQKPFKPTVIAGTERAEKQRAGRGRVEQPARLTHGRPMPGERMEPIRRTVRADEKVPVPVPTYVAAFLFGALALVLWGLWFRV